jgi:arylsulfatase A-like enzyme
VRELALVVTVSPEPIRKSARDAEGKEDQQRADDHRAEWTDVAQDHSLQDGVDDEGDTERDDRVAQSLREVLPAMAPVFEQACEEGPLARLGISDPEANPEQHGCQRLNEQTDLNASPEHPPAGEIAPDPFPQTNLSRHAGSLLSTYRMGEGTRAPLVSRFLESDDPTHPMSQRVPGAWCEEVADASSTALSSSHRGRSELMAGKKPNILILFGDDIGMWNTSYWSRGMMGYRTPNIDRVANEGVAFTDYYAQQSCTAGRAAFITGQNPVRTGLTKVGMPGATVGLQAEDPTIAELLKPLGYATGQFGKNHLGDRDEYLPTVHGFDEFFGNLYHLNAEEEPELPDYPKDPAFRKKFGPRGVLHCTSDGKGGQKVVDTGPLSIKRMETIDEEITDRAIAWMEKQAKADQPFFLWYNSTAMHFRTHLADKNRGKSGQDDYSDRMVTHDEQIGQILAKLDELGIADNTFVMYATDNGPENDTWPDGANTPFRSQKDTNWEGGWRVPAFIRWPGKIKPGMVLNGIVSHQDMLPTLLSMAGDPEVTEKLLKGMKVGDKTFKVHIDGYDMVPYLTGQVKESPRKFFFYMSDDGDVMAVRNGDWKFVLAEQRAERLQVWMEPLEKLRLPLMFNLRRDPFERAQHNSNTYYDWIAYHAFMIYEMQALVASQIEDFKRFPPRQKPASFNLDAVMRQVEAHH